MSKKHLVALIAFVLLISVFIRIRRYFFKSWTSYYQEKLYKEPRPLLVRAASLFKNDLDEKQALDLGAGVGNDTVYLLENGWRVWASDAEQEAINIIEARNDVQPYLHNLTLLAKDFNKMPWNKLPQFDLIYAGYSLPFSIPSEFIKTWNQVTKSIKPGGIFAGHFFGTDHGLFNWWVTRNMIFFSKQDLLNLFTDFHIEFFKEFREKNEQGVYDHSYEIIACRMNI